MLAEVEANVSDFSPAWAEIGGLIATREQGVFAETRGGAGRRWPMLRADTVIRKRREGFSTAPMVRTGSLLRELTNATPRKSSPSFAIWGPQDADVAQVGVRHKRGQGNAPQRDPAPPIRPKEADTYIAVMRKHVLRGIEGAP